VLDVYICTQVNDALKNFIKAT